MIGNERPDMVTGGCGFVGRHLVSHLIRRGHSIWIVDNLSTGKHIDNWLPEEFVKVRQVKNISVYQRNDNQQITFIHDDVIHLFSDQLGLLARSPQYELPNFGDVFHLAAVVGGRMVIENDPIAVATDLAVDALFFKWAVSNPSQVKRILYASSSAAYPIALQGEHDYMALKEEYIQFGGQLGQPDMTYGWSKLTGEYLATIAASKYGLHIACVRPFSGYGEDQDPSYPIPAIALRVARKENPLTVWGTGEQGRDFVYIDDCIKAIVMILDQISDGKGVNIGTGKLTTFLEIIKIFVEIEGYAPEIKPLVDKPMGVKSRYCDPHLIQEIVGWQPDHSLKEGLSKVLAEAHKRVDRGKSQ